MNAELTLVWGGGGGLYVVVAGAGDERSNKSPIELPVVACLGGLELGAGAVDLKAEKSPKGSEDIVFVGCWAGGEATLGFGAVSKKLPPPPNEVVEAGGERLLWKPARSANAEGFGCCCCGGGEEKLKLLKASFNPPPPELAGWPWLGDPNPPNESIRAC